jgi:hypothetical protein
MGDFFKPCPSRAKAGFKKSPSGKAGNVSPNTDNLGFIKTCQDALPKGTNIKKLRIDAAGYQASIIDYCFENAAVICSGAWVLLLLFKFKSKSKSKSKSNSTCPVTTLLCTIKSKTLPSSPINATNLEILSDSKIVHFYNQRAEDSENRIKELKNDFGAKQMPCADFNANALFNGFSSNGVKTMAYILCPFIGKLKGQ